jgi:hypothetical protein
MLAKIIILIVVLAVAAAGLPDLKHLSPLHTNALNQKKVDKLTAISHTVSATSGLSQLGNIDSSLGAGAKRVGELVSAARTHTQEKKEAHIRAPSASAETNSVAKRVATASTLLWKPMHVVPQDDDGSLEPATVPTRKLNLRAVVHEE